MNSFPLSCSPTLDGLRRIAAVLTHTRMPRVASARALVQLAERVALRCDDTCIAALAGTSYFRAFANGFPRSAAVSDIDFVAPGWLTRSRLLSGHDLSEIVRNSDDLISCKWITVADASGSECEMLKLKCHREVGLPVSVLFVPNAWYAQQLVEYAAASKSELSAFQKFARLKRSHGHAAAYNSLGIKLNVQRMLPKVYSL